MAQNLLSVADKWPPKFLELIKYVYDFHSRKAPPEYMLPFLPLKETLELLEVWVGGGKINCTCEYCSIYKKVRQEMKDALNGTTGNDSATV